MKLHRWMICFALIATGIGSTPGAADSAPLAAFNFRAPGAAAEWQPSAFIAFAKETPEGAEWSLRGEDPYLTGPRRDYPSDQPVWVAIRLWCEQGGEGQLFYGRPGFDERQSVRFTAQASAWTEVRLPLPPLGPVTHLRIDPPGQTGRVVLDVIRVEPRPRIVEPAWPPPAPLTQTDDAPRVRSGALEVRIAADEIEIRVDGAPFGRSHYRLPIVYRNGDAGRRLDPDATHTTVLTERGGAIVTRFQAVDADGATWIIERRWSAGKVPGTVELVERIVVDRDRDVFFLPLMAICAGDPALGTKKGQGLLAGVEYLDDEPSRSEADLRGPASRRRVPADWKLTFPLMAIEAGGRYFGLAWDRDPSVAAVFDSPDRTFNSGAHLMGLIFPGSDGRNRGGDDLLPSDSVPLKAGAPLVVRACLLGGRGDSAVTAVQHWVRCRGFPEAPASGYAFQSYLRLAAHGWLDSKLRVGNRYRHAVWADAFGPQPAVDAAYWMDWTADQLTGDATLAERLHKAAAEAREGLNPADFAAATVGHVHDFAPLLISTNAAPGVAARARRGHATLGRFEGDGLIRYHAPAGGPDYGSTHFAPDANGLTAQVVAEVLEDAVLTGDPELKAAGLRHLRALAKFRHTVPRGAQTWEIPLHTPDILASAHLVRAYTLGYELTGENELLDQAIYWAWSGVPFIYLNDPHAGPIGIYGTIAVLGSTGWNWPVWIGQPVQWCGQVYADALHRLAAYDTHTPWKRIADGITAASLQITWPIGDADRGGLLPDFFVLPRQWRDGPAINPATVQGCAARLFGAPQTYDHHVFLRRDWIVHAPGALTDPVETGRGIRFTVTPAATRDYTVLVNGLGGKPDVRVNGQRVTLDAPQVFEAETGRLFLRLQGRATVEINGAK